MECFPENIVIEKVSGKSDYQERNGYKYLRSLMRRGDTFVIHELERLGRNFQEIKNEFEKLNKEGIYIVVLNIPLLDTRKKDGTDELLSQLISSLALNIFAYIAQNELNTLNKRRKEGIEAAKRRGVHCGRNPIPVPDNFLEECRKWKAGKQTAVITRRKLGLAHTTFYKMYNKLKNKI